MKVMRLAIQKLMQSLLVVSILVILPPIFSTFVYSLEEDECISYDPSAKLITLTCGSWSPSRVYNSLNGTGALLKETNGTWLLNANLKIWHDTVFHINRTDTEWLKINSTGSQEPLHIHVIGDMIVDSVKISSWDTVSNNYSMTDGKLPRASITILPLASGKTDIFNSEIAYLGDGNTSRGQGLSYWAGDGSTIKNNTIHHMYYGFYSEAIGNVTIENNTIHNDIKYGLDPHTGTHDMIIRNNLVHDNGHIGIICSLDCKNITIEGNKVFSNTNAGIMLSKNVQNSTVRNNNIDNENTGISVSESSKDLVHDNIITDSKNGIQVKLNSSNNMIRNNSIYNSDRCGVEISQASSKNTVVANSLFNSSKYGVCLLDEPVENMIANNTIDTAGGYAIFARDSHSPSNFFEYNQLLNVIRAPVKITNGTLTVLNNTLS